MKIHPLALIIVVGSLAAGCSKQAAESSATTKAVEPAAGAGIAANPSTATSPDAAVIETYGWFLGTRIDIANLGLSSAEIDSLAKGLRMASAGTKPPLDVATDGSKIDAWIQSRQTAGQAKSREKNAAAATAYFASLKGNRNVVELPSGLRYEILAPGSGPTPVPSDTVKVNYEGKLIDGTVFDSSYKRGQPAEFQLNGVIAGWTEGLQKIGKGGKIRLHVPANLAYGDNARPTIPAGSTLIFEVELLDINPPAAKP